MEGRYYVGQLLGRLQDNFRMYKKCINTVVLKVPLFYYSKCELFDEQSRGRVFELYSTYINRVGSYLILGIGVDKKWLRF